MKHEVGQMNGGTDRGEGRARLTLNLIMPFEMPFNNAMPSSPQVTVPAHVLNSIVAAQNNLSSMIKELTAYKANEGVEKEKSNDEDTPITKKGS